jgi:hypothetical protein
MRRGAKASNAMLARRAPVWVRDLGGGSHSLQTNLAVTEFSSDRRSHK